MSDPKDPYEGVQFIDDKERQYFAQADLGQHTIDWLRGPVGRYVHGCARQEIEELRDALEACNPDSLFGRRKLRRLQKKAQAARYFVRWVTEVIQEGENAYQQLKEYRDE